MFYRSRNGWKVLRAALQVLAHDKQLLIFPTLSLVVSAIVIASLVGGVYRAGLLDTSLWELEYELVVLGPGLAFTTLLFFLNYLVVVYFRAGLVGAAYVRFRGGEPTIRHRMAAANQSLRAIVGYAFIATLGQFPKLRERWNREGRFGLLADLSGVTWTLATYLVVPVIVVERLGGGAAMSRSAPLLSEKWGPESAPNFGFRLLGLVLAMPGFLLVSLGLWVAGSRDRWTALVVLGAVSLAYWVALAIVMSALKGIYSAALYAYAARQEVRGFPTELASGAFSSR